ncbi:MAG TPA: hypothetical protein VK894_08345 [Jiangellales bacterium]|nr:hypothetical protein [Jiangellales bacterium]
MGRSSTISVEELRAESGELLPTRDAMALINITNITAVGIAISVNAASVNASANAMVGQALGSYQF